MSFKESLKEFIKTTMIRGDEEVQIDDDEDLFNRVTLDSMGVLEVTRFIEEETGLRVPDRELQVDNFQSISSIDRMVQRLLEKTRESG
jgi:acyl carrier protein